MHKFYPNLDLCLCVNVFVNAHTTIWEEGADTHTHSSCLIRRTLREKDARSYFKQKCMFCEREGDEDDTQLMVAKKREKKKDFYILIFHELQNGARAGKK